MLVLWFFGNNLFILVLDLSMFLLLQATQSHKTAIGPQQINHKSHAFCQMYSLMLLSCILFTIRVKKEKRIFIVEGSIDIARII